MTAHLDASTIAELLAERIEKLAIELVGARPTFRSRTELRFYANVGLAVEIAGRSAASGAITARAASAATRST